jgi:DNA-binding beta-propeller fold protein YncE
VRNPKIPTIALFLLLSFTGAAFAEPSFDADDSWGRFGIGREAFDHPVDVVADRDENMYIVDQGNNRIQVLDRRGRFLREWGGRGFGKGSFDNPTTIAIDTSSSVLYVLDTGNNRVQKFDLSGKYLLEFGRLGSGRGEFNKPTDLALDRKGNLYVADPGNNRIQRFDPTGAFIEEWGRYAQQRKGNDLEKPVSIAYSDDGFGNLFVLMGDCSIKKYDRDGQTIGGWSLFQKGEGLVCGPARIRIEPRRYTVYIADTVNDRMVLFDRSGELLGELRKGQSPFKKPAGLFINDVFGEDVLVADTGNNLIQKVRRRR